MKSLVWQQNCGQEVYGGAFHLWSEVALYTGGLYISAVGLDILKFEQGLL